MPPTTSRPVAKAGLVASKPVTYTRFSSKLTGSLDQISKMVEDNAKILD